MVVLGATHHHFIANEKQGMKKLLLQLSGLILLFFTLWLACAQLPWIRILQIDRVNQNLHKQLSNWALKSYSRDHKEVKDVIALSEITHIKNKICIANSIDTASISLHIFRDEQINAFAVPYQQIFIHTALIENCESGDMLAGVLAHEIAHIHLSHLSKRMTKALVIGGVVAMTGDNFGVLKGTLQKLSSKHFDREQEAEADRVGVSYLKKANISPLPLARFFEKLAKDNDLPDALVWLNTHPNSAERARIITTMADNKAYIPIVDSSDWQKILVELAK